MSERIRIFWGGTLLFFVGLNGAEYAEAAEQSTVRPNILFIYADDHSSKMLSCYERAYSLSRTPHIDRLADTGVRFQAAYLGSWCMPSRASLLTGKHPHAIESMRMNGPYPGSEYDPKLCPFWMAAFREHGYQTAQIGKWHTGTDTGWNRDWDFQIVWNRPRYTDNAGRYFGPEQIIEFNGEKRSVEGYSTDNYTNWACDYIRGQGRSKDKPWYLWLCYGAIHGPTTPAPRHKGTLAGIPDDPPKSIFGPRPGKPSYLQNTQAWKADENGTPVLIKDPQVTYVSRLQQANECLQAVDEGVGKLLQTLADTGQLEDTLVIYTSDQGFSNGEHGMLQKVAPYDATFASPLIISRPGTILQGKYCPQPVNAPDLIATFFAQAGIQEPWKIHGRDITPLLQQPDRNWEHVTLFMHTGQDFGSDVSRTLNSDKKAVHQNVPYYAAVRQGDFKYICYVGADETEELYDLQSDPEEFTNLVHASNHQQTLNRLREQLLSELRICDAQELAMLCSERQTDDIPDPQQ